MISETQNVKYRPESAGRLMISNVPTVHEDMNVAQIEKLLIEKAKDFETINYIYILDGAGKLTGVISIKEVFHSPKTAIAKSLSPKKLITAHAHTDQERAAHLALKNNLKEIPVVTKDNTFLGVVPNDTVLEILYQEGIENMLRLSGVTQMPPYDNIFKLPLIVSLKHRVPWLIVGLLGGILAAGIVSQFEATLSKNLILAAFIPLVVYMADAVGTQMEAFIIRDLAVDPALSFAKYLGRQASIVLIMGIGISGLLYAASLMLYRNPEVSFVLGMALFFAILTSLVTGLIIPFIFSKIRLDPANASGPIATIIQDVTSVLVYFLVAALIL